MEKESLSHLYRFRTIESLIDRGELADTYIYFAPPDKLNDPLEGYRRVILEGDAVVWENLFKHYFLCLLKRAILYMLDIDLTDENFPIHASLDDFPSEIRHFAESGVSRFLQNENIRQHIQLLAQDQRVVEQDEVRWHVRVVHMYALKLVSEVLISAGQLHPAQKIVDLDDELTLKVSTMTLELVNSPGFTDHPASQVIVQASLAHLESQLLLKAYEGWKAERSGNWSKITSCFSDDYMRSLDKLCKASWYVACFMRTPYNSAIWGTYGNYHAAVCLKFKVEPGREGFTLPLMSGVPKPDTSLTLPLNKVKYNMQPPALSFFKSLAFYNEVQLKSDWYTDSAGNLSSIAHHVFSDQDKWRESYWREHHESVTTKLSDWAGEDEYRILLQSSLGTFDEPHNRKLKYRFENLEGIIFGIKTPELDKFKLIDIVQGLCNRFERDSFEFYQAYHDAAASKISYRKVLTVTADKISES